jgi:hypothetical protein
MPAFFIFVKYKIWHKMEADILLRLSLALFQMVLPNQIIKGWELKTFSQKKITLMTPEPDQGFYREKSVKEFTLKYGHDSQGAVKYFTGTHKVDVYNETSKMTLKIKGFDCENGTIADMSGGLFLLDNNKELAAIWSFKELITHWSRKHSHVCYVKCKMEKKDNKIGYVYFSPVYLGESTDLSYFLKTMQSRLVVYDPATKVTEDSHGNMHVKPRNQFRINFSDLHNLYDKFYEQII